MKICIVSNSHPSNDVRLFYKLARSLAKQHEVWLLTATGLPNDTINPYQYVVEPDSPWQAVLHLGRKVRELKPDLLICVEPLTLLIARFCKKRLKLKVVFDVHEFYADAFSERFPLLLRFVAKQLYLSQLARMQRWADGIITVNQEILNQLLGKDKQQRGTVIPNYPVKNVWDYACDVPGGLSQICEMNFDLIYIGGLTVDRGIFKILKVASILKQEFPFLKIMIVGKFFDSSVEAEFNRSINSFNLNAIIFYQQWIPSEKIGLVLKRSRFGLWLFNSRSHRFKMSTPLKVLEYLAAGLPVITVKTPLMKALIEHNELGVCTTYQARQIASETARLLRMSDKEYKQMSQRCLDISENRFNWEALEPDLFGAIDRAMQR